ncbi:MAG: DUF692 domain-containing protein [Gammaproteobacteria bacterium]|nr:DUF692 domain-containing protein [Gammaproteobacteria bacterium]
MVKSPLLLTGVGLRTPHYDEFLAKPPGLAWVEVHSENYFAEGGKPLHCLEKIRTNYPVSLHGVSASLGSADELNWPMLKKLRDLIERIQPCLVSDHLSWSSIEGHYLHDLLPLPYTEETLSHVITRIQQVQDYLNRQILIENITSYIRYADSSIPEQDFLIEVAKKSGCGILLDVNNIYINAVNFGDDPQAFITTMPADLVQEIHVGGFTTTLINNKEVLIDTHNKPVVPAVWDLFAYAITQLGRKPTMIEWDTNLPSLDTLCLEAYRAEKILRENYVPTKSAS